MLLKKGGGQLFSIVLDNQLGFSLGASFNGAYGGESQSTRGWANLSWGFLFLLMGGEPQFWPPKRKILKQVILWGFFCGVFFEFLFCNISFFFLFFYSGQGFRCFILFG